MSERRRYSGAALTCRAVAATIRAESACIRPTIPDDSPSSESQFETMKYGPNYPERVVSLQTARAWMRQFAEWYNHEHKHSGNLCAAETLDAGVAAGWASAAAGRVHPR